MDGDAVHNPEAIMRIVDMMDAYNIGYGSVNHNRNRCLDCGYENADPTMESCPKCGGLLLQKNGRAQKVVCYNEDCDFERKL